ncbi:MAG: hypothetical protein WC451_05715 [Patescibacteria group bacterium]
MQTKRGYGLMLAVAAVAVVLAWTGRFTGWFDPQNIFSLRWGYLALGTLLALGAVKIIDRRRWVVITRSRLALRDAQRSRIQQRKDAVAGHILAMSLDSIQESLGIGPYTPEDATTKAPASATG